MAQRSGPFFHSCHSYNVLKVLILSLFMCSVQHIRADELSGTSPLILPYTVQTRSGYHENELVAYKGKNVTIKCISDEPVQWRLSNKQKRNQHMIAFKEWPQQNSYEAQLDLIDVNFKFAGFYYCVKKSSVNSKLQTQFQNNLASKIHLHIWRDDDHPMSAISNQYIQVRDNCDIFVPCKSTDGIDPTRLIHYHSETKANRTISDRTSGLFKGIFDEDSDKNIEFGYLVKNDVLIEGRNYFACLCNKNQTIITVDVKRSEYRHCPPNLLEYETFDEFRYVNEAIVSSKTDNYGVEGEDLEFNCTFYGVINGSFNATWQLPNDDIEKEGRMRVEFSSGISKLIVSNLTKSKDGGIYTCNIVVGNHSYSESLNVNHILGVSESFINIIAPNVVENGKGNSVRGRLFAKYSAYPKPSIEWRDANGNDISHLINKRFSDIPNEKFSEIRVADDDFGNYTVYAHNNRARKEKIISLIPVIGNIALNITTYKSDKGFIVACESQGDPMPKVSIAFCYDYPLCQPAQNADALKVTKINGNLISYHDFSQYDFNHIVNATCIADNGFEIAEVSKTIDRGLSMLDIIWIGVIICLLAIILLLSIAVCVCRRRRRKPTVLELSQDYRYHR